MIYKAVKRYGRTLNAHHQGKVAKLKRLRIIGFLLFDVLEEAKPQRQYAGQWLPRVHCREGEGGEQGGF